MLRATYTLVDHVGHFHKLRATINTSIQRIKDTAEHLFGVSMVDVIAEDRDASEQAAPERQRRLVIEKPRKCKPAELDWC